MSFARFSEGDIYVYLNTEGSFECCGCRLQDGGCFLCLAAAEMIAHVEKHLRAGHDVPARCLFQLGRDAETLNALADELRSDSSRRARARATHQAWPERYRPQELPPQNTAGAFRCFLIDEGARHGGEEAPTLAEALAFAEQCQRGNGPWCRHAEALLKAVRWHFGALAVPARTGEPGPRLGQPDEIEACE